MYFVGGSELLLCVTAKINEETGEDMDDNVYFDECDVDDDDIDEVRYIMSMTHVDYLIIFARICMFLHDILFILSL